MSVCLSVCPSVCLSCHSFLAATGSSIRTVCLSVCRPSVCHSFFTNFRSSDFYKIFRKHWKHLSLLAPRSSDRNIQRPGRGGHICVDFGRFCSFCRVRSVARCLFDRFASYVAQIQPMGRRCVAHHFQVKRSKVKVTRVVRSFGRVRSVARCLFDRFASYVAQIQPMGRRCVAHHFQVKRSKVKVTRVV